MKSSILDQLDQTNETLTSLYDLIKSNNSTHVTKTPHKESAKNLGRNWFDKTLPAIQDLDFENKELAQISNNFSRLLEYSRKTSRKQSYLNKIDFIKKDLLLLISKIEITSFDLQIGLNISPYLEGLKVDEKEYLKEAAKCAQNDCIRASILIGWCATIDRIHNKIEALGFDKFHRATTEMKSKTYGRFKRFKKEYNIESLSELREVFDTDLLWIIEYLEFIDSNQHERLRHCFSLRNHSGHPGEAPITGENLYSFYSDVTKIVLKNEKFNI